MKRKFIHDGPNCKNDTLASLLSIALVGSITLFVPACDRNSTDTNQVDESDVTEVDDVFSDDPPLAVLDPEPEPEPAPEPEPDPVAYSVSHVFSLDDITGRFDGTTYADDKTLLCDIDSAYPCDEVSPQVVKKTGEILYPIDSEFGYYLEDFVGAEQKMLDGDYAEGWANNIVHDIYGAGLMLANAPTEVLKSPKLTGTWCAGLGGTLVKCSTEHYTTLEHVLTCYETIPYSTPDPESGVQNSLIDPETGDVLASCDSEQLDNTLYILSDGVISGDVLTSTVPGDQMIANESSVRNDIAVGRDYGVSLKDDGKLLYRWGNAVKRPNDIRLYARMALPDEWKAEGVNYQVIKAELVVQHDITNNPNDQIRPEDMENESATGRLPSYSVVGDNWVSAIDCYEGDGDFIPAGTLFKNSAFAIADGFSEDLTQGLTNAWYTSIDRDPFEDGESVGPRWRLKANKFGQDIPSLEIPSSECLPPPFNSHSIKYTVGEPTTTTINLLDFEQGEVSPLATSLGWVDASKNHVNVGASESVEEGNGVSINGLPLTEDFDLAVYVKGDAKGTRIYNATLNIEYSPVNIGVDHDEAL